MPARTRALLLACAAGTAGACELTETVIAAPDDVVVAEFVLIADEQRQGGILHRTRGTSGSNVPLDDAVVEIRAADGRALRLHVTDTDQCFFEWTEDTLDRTACYQSDTTPGPPFVVAGREYSLRIALADGRVLTGNTTVPEAFELVRPRAGLCRLAVDRRFEIVWNRSPTAWVYVAETVLHGIQAALELRGIELKDDHLRLFGLSVSNADTTIGFPAEFGIFDRFDPDLTEALAAIQRGLPPDVLAEVFIAAADRNYVNWERGGTFNPSGFVRVPSVFGGGTGVFGSIVQRRFQVLTGLQGPGPAPC